MIPIIPIALGIAARAAAGAAVRTAVAGAGRSAAMSAAGEAATSGRTALKIGTSVAKQVSMNQKAGSGGSEPRSQNFSKGSGVGDVYGAFSN
jgi:hypothetical protein